MRSRGDAAESRFTQSENTARESRPPRNLASLHAGDIVHSFAWRAQVILVEPPDATTTISA